MIYHSGVDPDDLTIDTWCDVFLTWLKERIYAGDPKKAEHNWAEFEAELWDDVERTPEDEEQIAEQNAAALAKLGGPTSRRG